ITRDKAIIWSRSDRPARMLIEYANNDSFKNVRTMEGPLVLPNTDYTARVDLSGLTPGQRHYYRVRFQDLQNPSAISEPVSG
ncbi:PhoD-like phosphatase N-terminal domain-containing protein, partial [Escherichia coli]